MGAARAWAAPRPFLSTDAVVHHASALPRLIQHPRGAQWQQVRTGSRSQVLARGCSGRHNWHHGRRLERPASLGEVVAGVPLLQVI